MYAVSINSSLAKFFCSDVLSKDIYAQYVPVIVCTENNAGTCTYMVKDVSIQMWHCIHYNV